MTDTNTAAAQHDSDCALHNEPAYPNRPCDSSALGENTAAALEGSSLGEGDEWSDLEEMAKAATSGPWKACGTIYEHMNCELRGGAKGEGQAIAQFWDGPNAFRDGQFAAAANPSTVLRLIDQARALQPSSAADAKPVAWLWRDWNRAQVGVTLHKSEADTKRALDCEVEPLYAQPHPSQQAGVEVSEAVAFLEKAFPADGFGFAYSYREVQPAVAAILAALKPVSA